MDGKGEAEKLLVAGEGRFWGRKPPDDCGSAILWNNWDQVPQCNVKEVMSKYPGLTWVYYLIGPSAAKV